MGETKKILIVAKTYPTPSRSYRELVCTGGMLEDGTFIRLYPIDFRYRPIWQQYKKYQWIELEVEKNVRDSRPESYRPARGARIRLLNEVNTERNWEERKRIVLAKGVNTMCNLEKLPQTKCSLGIIKPREVTNVEIKEVSSAWPPRIEALFKQQNLFGENMKPLEKIPYDFRFIFKCEDPGCRGHKKTITDWEVAALYRNVRDRVGSNCAAAEKVRDKLLNNLCAPSKDTYFFVGTVKKYGSWIIVGIFYPKR